MNEANMNEANSASSQDSITTVASRFKKFIEWNGTRLFLLVMSIFATISGALAGEPAARIVDCSPCPQAVRGDYIYVRAIVDFPYDYSGPVPIRLTLKCTETGETYHSDAWPGGENECPAFFTTAGLTDGYATFQAYIGEPEVESGAPHQVLVNFISGSYCIGITHRQIIPAVAVNQTALFFILTSPTSGYFDPLSWDSPAVPTAPGWASCSWDSPGYQAITTHYGSQTFDVPCTVVQATLKSLRFAGEGDSFSEVRSEASNAAYQADAFGHHWVAATESDPIKKVPVQFRRNTPFRVFADFTIEPDSYSGTITNKASVQTTLPMTATRVGYGSSSASLGSQTVELVSNGNLPETAGTMEIGLYSWLYGVSDEHYHFAGNDTTHKIYLTLNSPYLAFHTCVDIACRLTSSDENDIAANIWSTFQANSVYRVEGAMCESMLYYYRTGGLTSEAGTTHSLLSESDGRCRAWAEFLNDTFKVHSFQTLTHAVRAINPIQNYPAATDDYEPDSIKIKLSLLGQGSCLYIPYWFNAHAVVVIGATIYDPSYCWSYTGANLNASLHQWEEDNLDWLVYRLKTDDQVYDEFQQLDDVYETALGTAP